METGAISNLLFVDNTAAVTQQSARPSRPQEKSFGVQRDISETGKVEFAEKYRTAKSEPLEFKRTLDKQSDKQTGIQNNEQEIAKSDNSNEDNTANYVLAEAGAVSAEIDLLAQQPFVLVAEQTSQMSPEQKAQAWPAHSENNELTVNQNGAAEIIGVATEKMSGDESLPNNIVATDAIAGQEQVQPGGQVQTSSETTELQQTIKTTNADSQNEDSQQVNQQAQELKIDSEGKNSESQEVKVNTEEVFNDKITSDVKAAQVGDTVIKDAKAEQPAENAGQMTGADVGQIKKSAGKETSENLDSTLLKQNSDEPKYVNVINTDTGNAAEKEADVSKAAQSNQTMFDKQVFDKVGEQLQASISNSVRQGESEVTVRLNPPELGQVVIKLQHQNGQINGSLEFSKAETKVEAQQLMPQLVRNLQDSGIAVKKLDVVQTQVDNSGQQQLRENVAGDGLAYQQQFSQGQADSYGFGYDWTSAESYSEGGTLSESYIGDQAVNILV